MDYEIAYAFLYEDIYQNFIAEAVGRSDVISLDIYWPADRFVFFDKQQYLDLGLAEAFYNSKYKHEEKCYYRDKSIFENECIPFMKKLEKYLINKTCFERDTVHYELRCDDELIPILQEVGSLDNWGFPNYPDNIAFSANGKPWFFCTNHGTSNANIRLDSKDEYEFWKELGIYFLEKYH